MRKISNIGAKFMTIRKSHLLLTWIILFLPAILFAPPLSAQKITVDTASARAVLKALQEPNLNYDQAMAIAKLEGNQGMIKEMRELAEADTDEQFAHALVAAAHMQPSGSTHQEAYDFTAVKNAAPAITILLDQIEQGSDKEIRDRIRPYAARPDTVSLHGFIVAGGDGGGYAFGGTDFYLNILRNDDILMAQQTLIHEAFHGAQGAVYHEDTDHWMKGLTQSAGLIRGKFCSNTAELFRDMKNEGTAMFVASDEPLKDSTGVTGKRIYAEYLYYNGHLSDSAGLLEISVASMKAPRPVPYKTVYSIDFWGKGVVYYISRAMTSAIVEQDGPATVGRVLQEPGYEFVLRYTQLKSYGKDGAHPRLGENTVFAAQSLHDGCRE
jgi:Putative zinc dependent peptidase (DUF5700)